MLRFLSKFSDEVLRRKVDPQDSRKEVIFHKLGEGGTLSSCCSQISGFFSRCGEFSISGPVAVGRIPGGFFDEFAKNQFRDYFVGAGSANSHSRWLLGYLTRAQVTSVRRNYLLKTPPEASASCHYPHYQD